MMEKVSESAQRAWGTPAIDAIGVLAAELGKDGFSGPMRLTREPSLPFVARIGASFQVLLSISASRESESGKVVDAHLSIWSRTLLNQAESEGFHSPQPKETWLRGFEPCLGMSLSHLVWGEAPSPDNPRWHLALGVPAGAEVLLAKIRQHFQPVRAALSDGDEALLAMLERAQLKLKPAWVLSSPPGFAQLDLLVEMLRRGIAKQQIPQVQRHGN